MRTWTTIFLATVGIVVAIAGSATWQFALLLARGAFAVIVVAALLYGVRWLALQMAEPHRLPATRQRARPTAALDVSEFGVFESTRSSHSP